jgi:hypothetical protein
MEVLDGGTQDVVVLFSQLLFIAEILLPAQGLGAAGVRGCLGSGECAEPTRALSLPPGHMQHQPPVAPSPSM